MYFWYPRLSPTAPSPADLAPPNRPNLIALSRRRPLVRRPRFAFLAHLWAHFARRRAADRPVPRLQEKCADPLRGSRQKCAELAHERLGLLEDRGMLGGGKPRQLSTANSLREPLGGLTEWRK